MSEPYRADNVLPLTEALSLSRAAGSGAFKVDALLDDQHGRARTDLTTPVEIIDVPSRPPLARPAGQRCQ